jgi:hypothetical protein
MPGITSYVIGIGSNEGKHAKRRPSSDNDFFIMRTLPIPGSGLYCFKF